MSKPPMYENGIQFQCQGSGNCCVARGGYGYVYLTKTDRQNMAKELGLTTLQFTKQYCVKEDSIWKLKDGPTENCVFLQDRRCTVYAGRPTQCRTWPFWPETLNARTWTKEIAQFCPGVGKGKIWSKAEVLKQLNDQKASEADYGS